MSFRILPYLPKHRLEADVLTLVSKALHDLLLRTTVPLHKPGTLPHRGLCPGSCFCPGQCSFQISTQTSPWPPSICNREKCKQTVTKPPKKYVCRKKKICMQAHQCTSNPCRPRANSRLLVVKFLQIFNGMRRWGYGQGPFV